MRQPRRWRRSRRCRIVMHVNTVNNKQRQLRVAGRAAAGADGGYRAPPCGVAAAARAPVWLPASAASCPSPVAVMPPSGPSSCASSPGVPPGVASKYRTCAKQGARGGIAEEGGACSRSRAALCAPAPAPCHVHLRRTACASSWARRLWGRGAALRWIAAWQSPMPSASRPPGTRPPPQSQSVSTIRACM